MKTFTEYILEKKSQSSKCIEFAEKIIDSFKNAKNPDVSLYDKMPEELQKHKSLTDKDKILNIKCYNNLTYFDGCKKKLWFIVLNNNEVHNEFNVVDSKDSDSDYYIIINTNDKDAYKGLMKSADVVSHELRHMWDEISGQNATGINQTYTEDDIGKYDNFLYYISPTEQNAMYTSLAHKAKRKEVREMIQNSFIKISKEAKSDNIDDIFAVYTKMMKTARETNADPLNNGAKIGDENTCREYDPMGLRFIEYNFYIMNSEESFKKFINGYEKKPDDYKHLITGLGVFLGKDDKITANEDERISIIYKNLKKYYDETYKKYEQLIKNILKK